MFRSTVRLRDLLCREIIGIAYSRVVPTCKNTKVEIDRFVAMVLLMFERSTNPKTPLFCFKLPNRDRNVSWTVPR